MVKNQDKLWFCSLCTRKLQNTKYPGAEKALDQTILSKKKEVIQKLYIDHDYLVGVHVAPD